MRTAVTALVVKIAERCNLNCSYCYIYNHEDRQFLHRPAVMLDEVFESLVERVEGYCDRHPGTTMGITFHGGEPTLVGPERLSRYAAHARGRLGRRLRRLSLQTNATLLDHRFIEVFKAHDIRVGVSLDGTPSAHDASRVDHKGRGSYERAVRGLELLQDGGLDPGVLTVINPKEPGLEVYEHLRGLGVRRISFLLPDVSHDNKARFYGGLGETPVADYLLPIFEAWTREDDPEIRLHPFMALLRLMLGGRHQSDDFGNPLMSYAVVETDGSLELLDALRVCADGMAATGLNIRTHELDGMESSNALVRQVLVEGVPLCAECRACPEADVCGGGYLPHRYSRARGFDNPSVWCADLKKLLARMHRYVGETSRSEPELAAQVWHGGRETAAG